MVLGVHVALLLHQTLLITKMQTSAKIGQVTVTCIAISDETNELEFTWVQIGRGFEALIGQCLEYPFNQKKAIIRIGVSGDKQPICFDYTGRWEEMFDGKQYACLISWTPGSKENPKIIGFGPKADFDSVVELLEAKKNTFVQSSPNTRRQAAKKSTFKFDVVPEAVEDPNKYRVNALGHILAGSLKEIVRRLTITLEDDPTENLRCGLWEKKGDDNRYVRCDRPTIPAPNQMLLNSFKARATA